MRVADDDRQARRGTTIVRCTMRGLKTLLRCAYEK